jgi:hypothetical protein
MLLTICIKNRGRPSERQLDKWSRNMLPNGPTALIGIALAQAEGQFWYLEEERRPPLEADTKGLVNIEQTGKTRCVP